MNTKGLFSSPASMTENSYASLGTIEMAVPVAPHLKIEAMENTSIASWHIFGISFLVLWNYTIPNWEY